MITIIDYGTGNIGSIANMLKRIGAASQITSNLDEIRQAKKIILCGVGAFDDGMRQLRESGLDELLQHKVKVERIPILGICLGMQLFTKGSEEGKEAGLGFIDGTAKRFNFSQMHQERALRIPHMGWNEVHPSKSSALLQDMYPNSKFYFVHSYHVVLNNAQDELFSAHYGYPFTAAFEKENIIGVQFHPEKSHKFGMRLYENFVRNY